ncbi:MAG: hypothetical protein A4E71_02346 [Smithella sp. PtaU1.Bin162]|nr:MAG: hypothetical protein A4E71_02346 [Smithella sp. PtaU1.Bin162]
MGKLNVCAADHLNRLHNIIRIFLQLLLQLGANGKHRRRAVGVAGMHAHGVDIFDEADRNHLIFSIAHHFEFQFFPSQYRFFHQDLADQTCRYAAAGDGTQLFQIVNHAAACAAHRIGRTNNHRITEPGGNFFGFFYCGGGLACRHINAQFIHGFLEGDTVFAAFNRIYLHADYFNLVLLQYPFAVQFRSKIEAGLAAQVRQYGIGFFIFDDFHERLEIQRFNIGNIGHARIGHDCSRVRIDKDDLVTQLAQCFTGLRSGIIKFTGLPDNDGAGTDNQHFLNVCAFCHNSHILPYLLLG